MQEKIWPLAAVHFYLAHPSTNNRLYMRIVFMGTPEFAVPSLDILIRNGYDVAGVVTATDKPGGRGRNQVIRSAVKQYAEAAGLRILQPERLRDPEFHTALSALHADLQIVVAFRMLPESIWSMPRLGTMNLHASLLPAYRGAAPINWAIINGAQETGLTTFFLKHEIDSGDLLLQEKIPIGPDQTAGELHDAMKVQGAELVLRSVRLIESGHYRLQPQDVSKISHAPKIFHETCALNFNQPVARLHNFVRGLSPYPAAWTTFQGLQLKVLKSLPEPCKHESVPGSWLSDGKSYLKFAGADGYLHILELQLEGKKRMAVVPFLNGFRLEQDT